MDSNGLGGDDLDRMDASPVASTSRDTLDHDAPAGVATTRTTIRSSSASIVSTTAARTRRLGRLGIPVPSDVDDEEIPPHVERVSSDDDGDGDTESLAANPPASHSSPSISKTRTTASAQRRLYDGTHHEHAEVLSDPDRRSVSAAISDAHFRDIVDELTVQNQRLKGRLKRYEAAQVPTDLRRERLFEVRFFEGLPASHRRDIEQFLQTYVQTFTANPSIEPSSSSGSVNRSMQSRTPANANAPSIEQTPSAQATGSTSSLGADLRSLRASEKESLYNRVSGNPHRVSSSSGDATSGGGGGGGGGGAGASASASGSTDDRRLLPEPITHPPALLRRPPDPAEVERNVLAAPSNSGFEPPSNTGTGSGMRISDPLAKRSRGRGATTPPVLRPPTRPTPSRRTSGRSTSGSDRDKARLQERDDDALAKLIVEMIECIFDESLPFDPAITDPPSPPNPLRSEPHPLPAASKTNTHYLREMLKAGEGGAGSWIYLNLLLTMAGIHRLSVGIAFVRHALRTHSKKIEVSDDGSKIRWRGAMTKPLASADVVDSNLAIEEEMEVDERLIDDGDQADSEQAFSDASGAEDEPYRAKSNLRANASATASSRPPKSLTQSYSTNSKSRSTDDRRMHSSTAATTASLLQSKERSAQSASTTSRKAATLASGKSIDGEQVMNGDTDGIRRKSMDSGAVPLQPYKPKHVYTPLFSFATSHPQTLSASAGDGDIADDASDNDSRDSKRRRLGEGGLVFFATDVFCSDLAGDGSKSNSVPTDSPKVSSSGPLAESPSYSFSEDADNVRVSRSDGSTSKSPSLSSLRANSPAYLDSPSPEADDAYSSDTSLRIFSGTSPGVRQHGVFPLKVLLLSGMGAATAADHFSIVVQSRHAASTASREFGSYSHVLTLPPPLRRHPTKHYHISSTELLQHHPAVAVRMPRLKLVRDKSETPSDRPPSELSAPPADLGSPEGDYLVSLSLPLLQWAPGVRLREEGSTRLGDDDALSMA